LQARDVAAARPLDAPLGFGSTRIDAAARFAPPRRAGRFALRAIRFGVPDPNVRGRQGVSALSGSVRPTESAFPEGRTACGRGGSGTLPKEAPRPHPNWAPKESVGCRWISPKEDPPRRSRRPKARCCRRDRDASPKRLVRDPVLAPKSGNRWFELLLRVLWRSRAYMTESSLAADVHTRR
jgi:hypothetical protein